MSLDNKPKGNPNWTPGKSGNPNGRPAGLKSVKTLLKVAARLADKKRHPVDELVRLADEAEKVVDQLIITDPGSTCWKVGDVVTKQELLELNSKMKADSKPAKARPIPGFSAVGKELSAKIWADLLKYCEPQKKAQEVLPEKPQTPSESAENAAKLLEEMENIANGNAGENTSPTSSNSASLDSGTPEISSETSPETDLRRDKEQ